MHISFIPETIGRAIPQSGYEAVLNVAILYTSGAW